MADSSFNCNHHDREQMSKLYTVGETVTFQCGNMQKEGTILIVEALRMTYWLRTRTCFINMWNTTSLFQAINKNSGRKYSNH